MHHARVARSLALLFAVLAVGVVAGCSSDGSEPGQTTTGSRAPVAIYLVRNGKVAPVRRTAGPASDPIHATLLRLLHGGPREEERAAGYGTALPDCPAPTTTPGGCDALDIGGGLAHVRSARPLSRLAQAQIVYTLTRFPAVNHVVFVVGGERSRRLTRADFEAETPQILVESPLAGEVVRSPIRLRGTANVFEATVSVDVRDANHRLLARAFTTATSGSGTRGTFDTTLALSDREGDVTVVAYESSAKDGRPLHEVEVPLSLER